MREERRAEQRALRDRPSVSFDTCRRPAVLPYFPEMMLGGLLSRRMPPTRRSRRHTRRRHFAAAG